MIVSKRTYNAIAAGGQHVTRWQARKVRTEILNPIQIRTPGGEIQEREGIFTEFKQTATDADGNEYPIGCPAPPGTVKPLRYRDKGKTHGRIYAVVVDASPYIGSDGKPMWEIIWERAGTKRNPIPDSSSGIYLSHEHGYTSSPSRALDPDAPVIPTPAVLVAIADDKAYNREQRRRRLIEMRERTAAVSAAIEQALEDLDLGEESKVATG